MLYLSMTRAYAISTFSRKLAAAEAGRIGLRLMSRYYDSMLTDSMIEIGEHLVTDFSKFGTDASHLAILSDAYFKNENEDKYLASLERLALMLPRDSLWRLSE